MTIAQLLEDLTAAVRRGDRLQALDLARQIQQRLATEAADRPAVERQVRALLAELDPPPSAPQPELQAFDPLAERSAPTLDDDDRLYPLWFGTNRRPAADGRRFSSERHHRTTLGLVTVRVPEAHRFGETGSSFWNKLRRLDFRDDKLRVHSMDRQSADAFYSGIQAAMQEAKTNGRAPHAVFFLHGFNVTFEDAA